MIEAALIINPIMTGFDRNTVINPARNKPNINNITPHTNVNDIAISSYFFAYSGSVSGSASPTPFATVSTADATIIAVGATGPREIRVDVPNITYRNTGVVAAYNPHSGGNPANAEYANDWGTNKIATVIPAIKSFLNHEISYDEIHCKIGNNFRKVDFDGVPWNGQYEMLW